MSEVKIIDKFPKGPKIKFTPYYSRQDFSEITQKYCVDLKRISTTEAPLSDNCQVCKIVILGDVNVGKTSLLNQ